MKVIRNKWNRYRSTPFFVLIPNMPFVFIERLTVTNEIVEYRPKMAKNLFFAYLKQVDHDLRNGRNIISKQILHEFVAREKLYRMVSNPEWAKTPTQRIGWFILDAGTIIYQYSPFRFFTAYSILSLSRSKQKLSEKFFLSKCSKLKALQTLKVSSKSETIFVRVVEILWK